MADETKQANGNDSAAQPGDAWGDPISEERRAELRELFERQKAWVAQPEATRGDSIFKGVKLTGADVFWLAETSGRDEDWSVPNLHLEGADLTGAHLKGAGLSAARLVLADLTHAHLEGADLMMTDLAGAKLFEAHLEGADLSAAHLVRADLFGAMFDKTTHLNGAILTGASLEQVAYDGVNLAVVDWSRVPVLGDELTAREAKRARSTSRENDVINNMFIVYRFGAFISAVRANRLLAVTLRTQGMNEDADHYAYHAQVMQRELFRWRKQWGGFLFSWFLFLVSGYGYRLWRILATYGAALLVFTLIYWALGIHSFPHESGIQALWDSFLVSLSAIHGRTTFEQLGAWSPAAWTAAVESVFGIVIEGIFVAMLIQRFFAR